MRSDPGVEEGRALHRTRSLREAVTSAAAAVVAAIAATFPIAWSVLAAPAPWAPSSDTSVIVLRSLDVFTRHSPLVGMPTTLSATAGSQLHHPGPLEMWLLALPSWLIGTPEAPMVTIALVNAVAVLAVAWWAWRAGGPVVAATVGLALGACLWPLRGDVLADPYNPYAGLLPFAAFLVSTVAVLERRRWAAPLAVVAGTYAAQSHLALFGLVAGVTAVVATLLAVSARSRDRVAKRSGWRDVAMSGPFVTAVLLGLVLWAPVLVDQLLGEGNLGGLLSASGSTGATLGWRRAASVIANAVGPWPVWTTSQAGTQVLLGPTGMPEVVVTTGVLCVAVVGAFVQRSRRPAITAAVVVCIACLATGTTLLSRLPDNFWNTVALYNYLWLWPLTLLLWGAAAASILTTAADLTTSPRAVTGRHVAGVAISCLLVVTAATGTSTRPLWPRLLPAVRPLAAEMTGALGRDGRYLMRLPLDLDAHTVAAGLFLALERDGFDMVVEDAHAAAFGDHRTRRDQPLTGTLSVVVKRTPIAAEDGDGVLLAVQGPRRTDLEALADAQAPLVERIEARGRLVLSEPRSVIPAGPAVASVVDGSIVGALSSQLVREPVLPRHDVDRLLVAETGQIHHVGVFLTSTEG